MVSRSFLARAVACGRTRLTRIFRGAPKITLHIQAPATPQDYAHEPDAPVLDIGVFRELHVTLGSDTDRLRNVYAKFLDTAAKRIDELQHQPLAASLKTLHALKGSAGMVGASRLATLADRLHDLTTDRERLLGAVAAIESELTAFRGVLRTQLDFLSGAR
jgi:HPt (histidine-containing phosphotransfer) domain-containing protein